MSDLSWEDEEKIPFDSEPIQRKPTIEYRREVREKKKGNSGGSKTLLYIFFNCFKIKKVPILRGTFSI